MSSSSIALRTCIDCEKRAFTTTDLAGFVPHPRSAHGHQNLCRLCASERGLQWAKENREKRNLTQRTYRARRRREADE